MNDRESHYKETLFKTKEQPVATTNQEEREVLYADKTGTYKLVRTVGNKTVSCYECAFASSESPTVGGDLLCGMFERKHFVKLND